MSRTIPWETIKDWFAQHEQTLRDVGRFEGLRGVVNEVLRLAPHAPEVAELLRDAYQEGYCDGQNNPNGYSSKVERDKCVARLLEPNP